LGLDHEEVLNSKRPLLEQVMKGVTINAEVVYLKNIQKAVKKVFEDRQNFPPSMRLLLDQSGPLFRFSSNVNIDLNYDDFEEF